MKRAAFLTWLFDLIRNAPEPTLARVLPETEEFEAAIEVVIGGTTFVIAVEEREADEPWPV